ncbi:Uncharacterized protein dnm_069110 [Desulfonema magnum]|uniref:Uncharacterized protein n=1 Tax=Desulfonema magnum TaxID=45655 RepID=A0A975BTA4_9BACT|nr:Uncharacterized protein dnm_069110 [Desulfonema magnum]
MTSDLRIYRIFRAGTGRDIRFILRSAVILPDAEKNPGLPKILYNQAFLCH